MARPKNHIGEWTVADEAKQKLANKPPATSTPTPTPTPPPTAPAGQPQTPQTPQGANYAGLTNKDGTIYLGDTPFSSPADLATHLGIQPHEINWGNIPQAETTPTTPTEISTDVLDTPVTTEDIQAQVTSPIESIQSVFGADWTPAPIFDQLGLTEQGIYGAVIVNGKTYTIGKGGRAETDDSFRKRFGTDDRTGIANDVDIATAIKLGINVDVDTILEPLKPFDPYEQWANFRDEDKAETDEMRTKLFEATNSLIDAMKGYGETKAEAKDEEKEKLGIDAKDKAITDAEKTYADAMQVYSEVLLKNRSTSGAMSRILGTESRITAQRAIEMAPLSANILIAQNSYDRAKDLLDDWSDDYAESMKFQMQAAQLNINMLTGELNREQAENLAEAQIKFDIWQNEWQEQKATQKEVQSLMLAFNSRGANININDTWEDALRKTMVYTKSDQDILDRLDELKLESAEVGLLLQKKSLAGGAGSYAPSALKKLYNELGGQKGTGMTYNEFYESEKGGGETSDDLISLLGEVPSYSSREEALTALNNYKTSITAKVGESGYNSLLTEVDRLFPEAVETEENLGSDFDYTPLAFKSEEDVAKSRADLPRDAKILYDKLKKENPYSSAAFLIRKVLGQ